MSASSNISKQKLLKIVQEELYKCIRCGECRTVCPIFREQPTERYTARGKLVIAEALAKGKLEFSPHVREALDNCVLCTGCASQCSSEVRADKVILAARQAFAKELGLAPLKKAISLALTQPASLLAAESRVGAWLQPLLFKSVPPDSGLHRRFAMPAIDAQQYIPHIAKAPFRSRARFAGAKGAPQVQFFTGCMNNYVMTEIADSLVSVLTRLGFGVDVPPAQACCGTPMLASGDCKAVLKQAKTNIAALANANAHVPIVVACSSCGHMLKHGYLEALRDEPELRADLEGIAARTLDISEFLMQRVGEEQMQRHLEAAPSQSITYHDPCHLRKAQKITQEPRTLLNLATQNGLHEMARPEACCGMGGTYFLSHLALSKQILQKKIADATATPAKCIATGCPGCIMQLRDGLRRSDSAQVSVKHTIQIIAEAMDKGDRQ